MRSPALRAHIAALPATAWTTVRLDRDGAYRRPKVVDEQATLSAYPRPLRQLIVTGLGRDAPTVIITNDRVSTAKGLIERYARRMNIEQRLAESIRSFHTDALAGAVPLNVALDVAPSVLAGAVCASLRRRLTGYHHVTPDTLQRRFLSTGGTILNHGDTITVSLNRRPTPRCYAKPTSPTSPSQGGKADDSTSNSTNQLGVEFAARKSALTPTSM